MTNERRVEFAAAVFLAGFVVHNADHARRGLDRITEHVIWGGTVVAMMAAVIATLVFTRHPTATKAAMVGGAIIAVSVSASHLLPDWSAFSDPLPGGDVDALTWVAVLAEVVGAVVMAVTAGLALRSGGIRGELPFSRP